MTEPAHILTADEIPALVGAYRETTGASLAGLSRRIFNDPNAVRNLVEGKRDIASRRLRTLVQWFSDHWPEGAVWPDGVPRPKPDPDGPASIAHLIPRQQRSAA